MQKSQWKLNFWTNFKTCFHRGHPKEFFDEKKVFFFSGTSPLKIDFFVFKCNFFVFKGDGRVFLEGSGHEKKVYFYICILKKTGTQKNRIWQSYDQKRV